MRCQCTTCRPAAFVVGIRTRVNNVLVRSAELRCTHLSKPKRNLNLNLVESASFERSSALMLLTQGIQWIYFSSEMISSLGPHDPTLGIQLNSHAAVSHIQDWVSESVKFQIRRAEQSSESS